MPPDPPPELLPELLIEALAKQYGQFTAVAGLDLEIRRGEFTTILGPSGSGKTTTLMMIAGFAYPTSGRIVLRGQDITFMPPHLRNLGMVFQNYALFPHLTIAENVAFPLQMRRASKDETRNRVAAALELVQLTAHAGKHAAQLSGGQQQRVALARALVYGPSLLLMDEPLGALDKALREHLQLQIKRIQKATGVTIVYVTHDQDEALAMSDRVVVMDRGRIRGVASPASLYERPPNAFVASFVGEINLLRGTVVRQDGPDLLLRLPGGAEVGLRGQAAVGATVAFSVRPERMRCIPAAEGGGMLQARVTEVIYLGDVVKYQLQQAGDPNAPPLLAKTLAPAGGRGLPPGTHLHVCWNREDAWLLPEQEGCA